MPTTTNDIVAKLWNLCNVLKDDGVTYHQYVSELTYLLFLKMAKETGTEAGIPEEWRWDELELGSSESGSSVLERWPATGLLVGCVPGLPGAHSQGETLDEVQANLQVVIALLLEDCEPSLQSGFVGLQQILVPA